jgi:predicted NBD/HSP70 family sugar kinase
MKSLSLDPITENTQTTELINPAKTARLLLRLLRAAQPVSRIELARRLGINRSIVTDTFKPLIKAGIIREMPLAPASDSQKTQGRPPVGLSYNSENDFFIGVNIGVRHSQVGLTTLSSEILAEEEFVTPSDPFETLALVQKSIRELYPKSGGRALKVIGVSVPGPTDAGRSRLLYAPHLGWENIDIAEIIRKGLDSADRGKNVSIVVENDATAAALYESRLRLQNTNEGLLKNFVLLRSGTGIGIGLVIESEVYRGAGTGKGIAGEFGHMTIVAGGKACVCGNRGCWEKYASAAAAASLYTGDRIQLGSKAPRFLEIVKLAEAGEIRAQRTLERIGEYLGIGIGNVMTGLGVPHVIVSGRLVYGWKFIQKPLFDAVRKSMAGKLSEWTIECGEPKGAAIGGALEVAVEEYLMRGLSA